MLGGLTQQRVSQLVRKGELVAERDGEGKLRYDRITVEHVARERAARFARSSESAEEKKLLQQEARERFKRQREREAAAKRERERNAQSLYERGVLALERIAECLRRQS